MVGLDFSAKAIATARDLASDAGLADRAQFVEANVYDTPEALAGTGAMPEGGFDVVFTSYGVLTWLPDIGGWVEVVADCLAPGGTFYVANIHPFSHVLMDVGLRDGRLHSDWPYFGDGPRSTISTAVTPTARRRSTARRPGSGPTRSGTS